MKIRLLILFFLLIGCNSQHEFTNDDVLTIGQNFISKFHSNELENFHNKFYDKSFSLQDLIAFRNKVENELGSELEVFDEIIDNKIWKNKQYYGYVRYSNYSKVSEPIRTIFAFDKDKTIYRFEITQTPEPTPSKFDSYTTKTELILPFEGEWYVAAGGRSSMYNHHTKERAARFAIDFMIKKDESYYSGTGRRNEDFYSFNKKILSPGSGTIAYVENDIKENRIGFELPNNPGNRVTINHGNGEFSFLCHFKRGSISVKVGDSVQVGQYLGLCGNSGVSYASHIHYHMQNTAMIFSGDGLPILFKSFYSDDKYVKNGELEYGKYVKNKKAPSN